ncbi:MAG: hypothetical protein HYY04_04535 [Chloroflexi bacterium]|nr:hypothetical protein [Chloroflexota bacterium]
MPTADELLCPLVAAARLELDEHELQGLLPTFRRMRQFADQLQAVELGEIEPASRFDPALTKGQGQVH